jgi:hypothetical protein
MKYVSVFLISVAAPEPVSNAVNISRLPLDLKWFESEREPAKTSIMVFRRVCQGKTMAWIKPSASAGARLNCRRGMFYLPVLREGKRGVIPVICGSRETSRGIRDLRANQAVRMKFSVSMSG